MISPFSISPPAADDIAAAVCALMEKSRVTTTYTPDDARCRAYAATTGESHMFITRLLLMMRA